MNKLLILISIVTVAACTTNEKLFLTKNIAALTNNSTAVQVLAKQQLVLGFWQKKYIADSSSYTYSMQYASYLALFFAQNASIDSLLKAESIFKKLNKAYPNEANILRSLAHISLQKHLFSEAYYYAKNALKTGENRYQSLQICYDAAFELGYTTEAKVLLKHLKKDQSYAYYFRLAKMQHFENNLDAAQVSLSKAEQLAFDNEFLANAARLNSAILYQHHGQNKAAAKVYHKILSNSPCHYPALLGLAQLTRAQKDTTSTLALLNFLKKHHYGPEVLYQEVMAAQVFYNEKIIQKSSDNFLKLARKHCYGGMYHKYQIDLEKNNKNLLLITQQELKQRKTAQTYSWLCYAYTKNNELAKAQNIYKKHVTGQALEAFEQYYIGQMMLKNGNTMGAKIFFDTAYKNRFELSPKKQNEIERFIM
jgi:predicted Zn-dependent protease